MRKGRVFDGVLAFLSFLISVCFFVLAFIQYFRAAEEVRDLAVLFCVMLGFVFVFIGSAFYQKVVGGEEGE